MPKNIDDLLARNADAGRLVKAGFTIGQAQGPDYDESGDPIVYQDENGNPNPQPPLVWWVELCDSTGQQFAGAYINDDDADAWARFGNPAVIESLTKQMRSNDPDDSFHLSDDEVAKLAYDTSVATGDLTQKEADTSYKEWQAAQAQTTADGPDPTQPIVVGNLTDALAELPDGPIKKSDLIAALADVLGGHSAQPAVKK